ncbi:MAG: amylo-alpha-1,6-glucosidase [Candidatus Pacearchaeota archaeon]
MKTINSIEKYNQSAEKETEDISFLMTNKNAGFIWFSPKGVSSRYQGVFFNENEKMFRVIESIGVPREVKEIKNFFYKAEIISEDKTGSFFIPDYLNGLAYESSSECEIILDFKEAYENDYSTYDIEREDGHILVRMGYKNADYFLSIRFKGEFIESKDWIEKNYEYDLQRNSFPSKRSVFVLGKIYSEKIAFYFSKKKENAIKGSQDLYDNLEEYKEKKKKRIERKVKKISDREVSVAYNSCRFLLDNLFDNKGLFAGLPWFFQYWARDELISLGGFYEISKKDAKKIIEKWIKYLKKELIDFPAKISIDSSKEGNSIDSFGWLLKRATLFPELLQKNKIFLEEIFSSLDAQMIYEGNNTWMDSIKREGAIEIQAMKLFTLNLASKLTNKKRELKVKERLLREKVKKEYFDGNFLYDSLDKKVRPNIFIAYYFYPSLLSKKEWETCFDNALEELWCEWGGLSTISKKDYFFQETYTGEIPRSYHNGDSWFWINNLAGLVLADLNKRKYCDYIKKILRASTEEILFSGAAGCHAELSSAKSLKSQGAVCQSFSAGMYIELVDKLCKKGFFTSPKSAIHQSQT